MASASSSIVASGSTRVAVSRHASLQPVSSLRIKPFSNAKTTKSRQNGATVGVRNSRTSTNGRKPWPVYAAETDPAVDGETVEQEDVQYDDIAEEDEFGEAEAIVELSEAELADSGFMGRKISKFQDEALGTVATTAEEDAAAEEREEGINQIIQTIMDIENLTSTDKDDDTEEGDEAEESPIPFSDEGFYDAVYKNIKEIETMNEDIVDPTEKNEFDYALINAISAVGPDAIGTYPTAIDEQLAKYELSVDELTAEEQKTVDLANATVSDDLPAPPRGIDELLSAVEFEALTEEEQKLLNSVQPGELDSALKEEVDAFLAVSMQAAGVPSKIDMTTSAMYVMSQLSDAAKTASGADYAARSLEVLAQAKASGEVSDSQLTALTAAAESFKDETFAVPEGLFRALGEKLEEVGTSGVVYEEVDDVDDTAALEAEIASLLATNNIDTSQFAAMEAQLASLTAPEAPMSAAAQFLTNAQALLGDDYAQLVTDSIAAANDPAQVAAAKEFFLSEAKSVLSAEELTTVSNSLTDLGFADEEEPQVPTINVPSLDEFFEAPEVEAAVGKAIKAAVGDSPVPVLDASNYVTDKSHPVYVEYEQLKAEMKEATGVDLDNYAPQEEEVIDERMLSVVALMLRNAADGKPLSEGVEQLEIPQEALPAEEPLSADLLEVRAQLDAIWAANSDLSFTSPSAREVDESVFAEDSLTIEEAEEAEELSPEAGLMELESDSATPQRTLVAEVDADIEVGEVETAEEAKWMEVSEEEWEEAARGVLIPVEEVEEEDPEVSLARAEEALERFAAKDGFDEEDADVLQEIVSNLADVQLATDPSMMKVKRASLLMKAVRDHAAVVERALASSGRGPSINVPESVSKEQAAQFVQAYGNKIEEALKAADERAQRGIYVRTLADAINDVAAPSGALDADTLEAELRSLAASTLSPEEIADIEANTPEDLVTEDTIAEVSAEEYEEQLKEQYTETEIEDFKARGYALATPLPVDTSSLTASITTEAQIDSLLASMGVTPEPEPELLDVVETEAAVVEEEAVSDEVVVAEGGEEVEVDEMAQAFKELLDEVIDEVREAADDAEYVEDATVYDAAMEADDAVDAEDEVEEDVEFDEDEAQSMLDDVLASFANEDATAELDLDDAANAMDDAVAAAGGEDEADDDGEAELQTIYNTSASELLAMDYDDVWDAMGIPEARPKVPSKPRFQEKGADEAEEPEMDGYEEEEELMDAEGGEDDVADAIAEYYKADELDDEEGARAASLSAPKTTLDLFGSSPYLEDEADRAADDTQGLLERVTVSKTGDIFVERIIQVNRVTKVVKGGKIMSFRCVAIVGNRNGIVGVGVGSAREVVQAVTKACQDAKSSLIAVPLTKFDSIPHRVESKFKASIAIINPAADGTGCIAGGAVRSVLELAGVKNCLAKRLGSRNPLNNARATIKALEMLQTWGEVAGKRNLPISYLFAKDEENAAKALSGSD